MNLARGREYSAMGNSIDVQVTFASTRRMVEEDPRRIRVTFRPSGVWATSLYRTVLKHEAIALLATRSSFARTLLLIVTLLFVSLVTTYRVVPDFAILPSLQQF